MGRFTFPFTPQQLKALAIMPKIFATPSIIGSIIMIQHILRNKQRRHRVYHRLVLLMSIHDFIFAIKAFLSTWPIPKGTRFSYGAIGTVQTCTAAGFFGHAGSLTSICYKTSITTYFLLVVRYGWTEEHIQQRNVERRLHLIPLLIGWSTSIAGLPLTLYNASLWSCTINKSPRGCTDDVNCTRGNNAGVYRWTFFHTELWIIFIYTIVALILIYHRVLRREKATSEITSTADGNKNGDNTTIVVECANIDTSTSESTQNNKIVHTNNDNDSKYQDHEIQDDGNERRADTTNLPGTKKSKRSSKKYANQAKLFAIALVMTWIFPMLQAVLKRQRDVIFYPLVLIGAMCISLQGTFDTIVYFRPRYLRLRKLFPNVRWYEIVTLTLSANDDYGGGQSYVHDATTAAPTSATLTSFPTNVTERVSKVLGSTTTTTTAGDNSEDNLQTPSKNDDSSSNVDGIDNHEEIPPPVISDQYADENSIIHDECEDDPDNYLE